jgi:predicted dienelactone hydrolase
MTARVRLAALVGVLLVLAAGLGGPSAISATPLAADPAGVSDPSLPGPYPVGVIHRTAVRTLPNGDRRAAGLWIWYPALSGGSTHPVYGGVVDAPPVADGSHPLVVFSHGHDAQPRNYRSAIAHLASHGFVVAAPMHNDCVSCTGETATLIQNLLRVGDASMAVDVLLERSSGDDPVLRSLVGTSSRLATQ